MPIEDGAGDVTLLLRKIRSGDAEAASRLLPMLYNELRGLARHYLQKERQGHSLQPTALVHEAYLRMTGHDKTDWQDRAHFLATAAKVMRRVLVDYARRRRSHKRGGGANKAELQENALWVNPEKSAEILDLDEALRKLEQIDERQCRIVEMRYFAGLTVAEIGAALGIAERTVLRDWAVARAWLFAELKGESAAKGDSAAAGGR